MPDPLADGNDAGSHLDARHLGLWSHRAVREDGRVPEIADAVIGTDGCPEIAVAVNRTDGCRKRPRCFARTGDGTAGSGASDGGATTLAATGSHTDGQ